MTDKTPAMPELPDGVTLEDLLIPLRAALSTCHDTGWSLRQFKTHITHALAALQSAQPADHLIGVIAQYVADHCVDGESHASVIRGMAERYGQPQPAEVSDADVWELWLRVCAESENLSTRVMIANFARALRPQAAHPDTARCIKARNKLNAALYGEGALIDDLEHAVANACAKVLRPQAVPMTDEQVQVLRFVLGDGLLDGCAFGDIHPDTAGRFWWRADMRKAFPGLSVGHGITPRADGGEG